MNYCTMTTLEHPLNTYSSSVSAQNLWLTLRNRRQYSGVDYSHIIYSLRVANVRNLPTNELVLVSLQHYFKRKINIFFRTQDSISLQFTSIHIFIVKYTWVPACQHWCTIATIYGNPLGKSFFCSIQKYLLT